jgi:large subunit ribosomal protein L4
MATLTAPVVGGSGTVDLSADVFGHEPHRQLLYEAVRAEMLARRQGTSDTKTRGRVAGGASKPWRQKGTGRARAGTTRSPLWKGGGVVFGPHPREYGVKMNRKATRRAKLVALSQHAALQSLGVFDGATFSTPRTKDARALVGAWDQPLPLVVLVGEEESPAALSFRNLERVIVAWAEDITVVELLWARSLLVSQVALDELQGGGAS